MFEQILDSATSIFFERQLEQRLARTYDIIRAPLKAFDLIPVSNELSPAASTYSYGQYDMTGLAKIVSNYANDFPRADVLAKEFVGQIRSVGDSFGYSIQEIRQAMLAGVNLEQRKANAAAYAQRLRWEQIAFYGDAEYNLPGWLTNTNIPTMAAAATGTGSSTLWKDKSPANILADMNALVGSIKKITKGVETPNTIVLPTDQYTIVSTTPRSEYSDKTILQFFLENNKNITRVEECEELASDTVHAIHGGDIMIAYDYSADKFCLHMPQLFEQFPPQARGMEFIIYCHSRIGGTCLYYPLSQAIMTGI